MEARSSSGGGMGGIFSGGGGMVWRWNVEDGRASRLGELGNECWRVRQVGWEGRLSPARSAWRRRTGSDGERSETARNEGA